MALKLYPPDAKHPTWRVRGTYYHVNVDRSTGSHTQRDAQKILARWKAEIERRTFATPTDPTFAAAAVSYAEATGNNRSLERLVDHFGNAVLKNLTQADIDAAAAKLLPDVSPATRNREVYTPISAIMRHAGIPTVMGADGGRYALRRPDGANGNRRLVWLKVEEADALISAARARVASLEQQVELTPRQFQGAARKSVDAARRFTALCLFLLYTGARLQEALRVRPQDVELSRAFAFCGRTKNGDPRAVHLPPVLHEELSNLKWGDDRIFGIAGKCGRLYKWLDEIATAAGVTIPDGVAFHIFRHTYGAWMRRYAGLDTTALVATGAWRSATSARIYEHVETADEARKADLLPTGKSKKSGESWEIIQGGKSAGGETA
jgi:integrase